MNIQKIRADFPILKERINGHQLIYFDNAATTQKPQQVLDSLMNFYTKQNASIHRSIHTLGEQATVLYEQARERVAQFINAQDASEIVFTRGATHSINAVAHSFVLPYLSAGDELVITELEHHSNLLVWQWVCKQTGATLKYIPVNEEGEVQYDMLDSIITARTKFVAICHESNAIGTLVDISRIVQAARAVGAKILVDAAQSAPHQKLDVQAIDCDFLVFSGHKMLAPTGIGVLYVQKNLHDALVPFEFGGGMLYSAQYDSAQYAKMPQLLEAGSPAVAQAVALHAAIDYLEPFLINNQLRTHESQLCAQLIDGLQTIQGLRIIGPVSQIKGFGHLVSFTIDDMHPHDIAAYLDTFAVCVRAGHLCAQPLAHKLGVDSLVRASFYIYNTEQEVHRMVDVLTKMRLP